MRYLIVSDIHANWEALQAVVEAAGKSGWDEVVCLGDVVGYGADPNPCVEWVMANARHVVRGNHDKACVGLDDLEWFNPVAARACRWTQEVLTADAAEWLRQKPMGPKTVAGKQRFTIAHGSPADEDQYVVNLDEAEQLNGYLEEPVTFFGHTHLQGGFEFTGGTAHRIPAVPPGEESWEKPLQPDARYLINPGSVGQPRDGDWRAAWAMYEPSTGIITYGRVPYDVETAQAKIVLAGLPEVLAYRLAIGH